jgi:hypothetical protein
MSGFSSFGRLRALAWRILFALGGAAVGGAQPLETEIRFLSGRGPEDAVEWEFMVSDGRRAGERTKIRVPSVWEQEGFGTYNYGIRYYGKSNPPGIAREQGKYWHAFEVPAEWQHRRVKIVFEGAMTDTHVRLNGISMGPPHQGGFYRFSHEITQWLKFGGTNQLEITVDKESANESVNMAERRADYWNFGGIFRPVWLEVLPAQFIERVAIDARADGEFRADVYFGDAVAGDRIARVTGQILDATDAAVGEAFAAEVAPGTDRVTLRTRIDSPRTWTAETPHLYRVRVTLSLGESGATVGAAGAASAGERAGDRSPALAANAGRHGRDARGTAAHGQDAHATGEPVHVVTERFGFRTFEVREGEGVFLNGRRILLKGINRHSFRPETGRTLSRKNNYDDVRLIKAMNMNAVRLSHYPADPAFLEACDELGLYVLNELGGWHGAYDAGAGRPLVRSLVTRDVNHPCVIFWDNGNEGGWNPELDGEFHRWDPQKRPVLHPQKKFSGVETMHYRSYGEVQEYLRGREIYLPTEFLHGLYDGGHGAGLWDYWEMMRRHPRSGGGFLWVLADEGIMRTDQSGRIDTAGNYGADGIVGPHHEKEGSFWAVKEIWSPVQVWVKEGNQPGSTTPATDADRRIVAGVADPGMGRRAAKSGTAQSGTGVLPVGSERSMGILPMGSDNIGVSPMLLHARTTLSPDFDGTLGVENRYDFLSLDACRFTWALARFPLPDDRRAGQSVTASGEVRGPAVAPHDAGELRLPLPSNWREADVLYVTAQAPNGDEVWTWSWSCRTDTTDVPGSHERERVDIRENSADWRITAGSLELRFDKGTGELAGARRGSQTLSLGRGPRFIAARRGDRSLDGWVAENASKGGDRVYRDVASESALTALRVRADGEDAVVEADYFGPLRQTRWRITPSGVVQLDYAYGYDGVVELLGVHFAYPEDQMRSIRWLGRGPYRVWQNRLHGTRLGVWENNYNDSIPAESFVYPEFKGYFADWRWATFHTSAGVMTFVNRTPGSYLGVLTPRDGRDALLFTLPETGIGVFDVIPAIRNKVNATDLIGPSSQPQRVSGERRGRLILRFE